MKKILIIIGISVLLYSCATLPSREYQSANGGQISAHFTSVNYGKIQTRANFQCKQYNSNSVATNIFEKYKGGLLKLGGEGGEYSLFKYNCKTPSQREMSAEYDRYIAQCQYIGFKKNTEKMGECVLKIHKTESQLATFNAQQRTSNSSDVLANMFLLNESLKLLNPPKPKSITCQARPFGIYMNVYCN